MKYNIGDKVFFKYLNPNNGDLEFIDGDITEVSLKKDKEPEYNVSFYSSILNANFDCLFKESCLYKNYEEILYSTYKKINSLRIDYEIETQRFG